MLLLSAELSAGINNIIIPIIKSSLENMEIIDMNNTEQFIVKEEPEESDMG